MTPSIYDLPQNAPVHLGPTPTIHEVLSFFNQYKITLSQIYVGENKANLLHMACRHNEEELVESLLNMDATLIRADESNQDTPLHIAAQYASPKVIQSLIRYGASDFLQTKNGNGKTPFFLACIHGNIENAQFLFERGAEINVVCEDEHLLVWIMKKRVGDQVREEVRKQIFSFLIKNGADISYRDHKGKTIMHHACEHADVYEVQLLLDNNVDVTIPCHASSSKTPLAVANNRKDDIGRTIAQLIKQHFHKMHLQTQAAFRNITFMNMRSALQPPLLVPSIAYATSSLKRPPLSASYSVRQEEKEDDIVISKKARLK